MRWLRFAAFGALVPLALFGALANNPVFEASALRTVERGCRRPEIRGGRTVARSGVRVKPRFESGGNRT